MKAISGFFSKKGLSLFLNLLFLVVISSHASARCPDTTAPVYSHTCSNEYFESVNITGAHVSSTVYFTGITSCRGTYINDYTLQGTTAPGGSGVSVNIARYSGYAAYLSVYIDWNNNGIYETTELAGSMIPLNDTTIDTSYQFIVPTSGAVTSTRLHMRLMLSEDSSGAPCNASFGQTYDYFFIIDSVCTMPVIAVRPSTHDTISNCPGGTGVLISASGAGLTGTFTWSPATGLSATTGGMVVANPAATTIYTISGTSTGTCTATFQDTVNVISTGYPLDTIFYPGTGKYCSGDTVMLTGTAGPGYTYTWFDNGVPGRRRSPFYGATTSGVYTLVINAYGCIDTSAPVTLTFNLLPAPVITYSGGALRTTIAYAGYQWYENGSMITGASADTLKPTTSGIYNVVVTDSNGCSDSSFFSYSYSNLAVNNVINSPRYSVYPNPTNGVINIISPIPVKAVLTGIEGNKLMELSNASKLDINALQPGIYFIELYDESNHRVLIDRVIKN